MARQDSRDGMVEMPCGHVVGPDPERADWCSACEKLEAEEEFFNGRDRISEDEQKAGA